jgi:hypothetical protein
MNNPPPTVERVERDGKTLLVLTFSREASPPYSTTLPGSQGKPVEFYARRDATTFPARADETRNAVLAAAPPSISTPPSGQYC